jgi:hypothetical protein
MHYAAFRWGDNRFCKSEHVKSEMRAKLDAEAPTRFENLLNLYSKLDGLADDRAKVFSGQQL